MRERVVLVASGEKNKDGERSLPTIPTAGELAATKKGLLDGVLVAEMGRSMLHPYKAGAASVATTKIFALRAQLLAQDGG